MTIVLSRVDDRLVHGQVVIGWGRPLGIERIGLVDAAVAASDFERDLYRMAVPQGMAIEFLDGAVAAPALDRWASGHERVLVLTGTVAEMAALHGVVPGRIERINLGGIHAASGRREYLRYVYLSPEEVATLRTLASAGVRVTAQDLPTTRPVPLEELLR